MDSRFNEVVLHFPGVGCQHTGMGYSFYKQFPCFREAIEEASDILDGDLAKYLFKEEFKEELNSLRISQIAILVVSVAYFRVLVQEFDVRIASMAGHSLGEYSALCAAGAFSISTAARLIDVRNCFIEEACREQDGQMLWVVNLEANVVARLCESLRMDGHKVYISAFDSPSQCSVSGNRKSVSHLVAECEKLGAIIYPLKLSGAFHCPLMHYAKLQMESFLGSIKVSDLDVPVVANWNGKVYGGAEKIKEGLAEQLVSPIHWLSTMRSWEANGYGMSIEVGPKEITTFLMKKSVLNPHPYAMGSYEDFGAFSDSFKLSRADWNKIPRACMRMAVTTPNINPDASSYDTEVLQPYQVIQSVNGKIDTDAEHSLVESDVVSCIESIRLILVHKLMDERLVNARLSEVLGYRFLEFFAEQPDRVLV